MGRAPCCEKVGLKRGRWTAEEDEVLTNYIRTHGEGHWRSLPKNAGLLRCGKSCRLRWVNYLRADVKRGNISAEEENIIIKLHASLGNRWSLIANHLPGRTDNEIKNYWNSHLSRRIDTFRRPANEQALVPMVVMDAVKVNPPKKRKGRTSRWAMKKNKTHVDSSRTPPARISKDIDVASHDMTSPPTPPLERVNTNIYYIISNNSSLNPSDETSTRDNGTASLDLPSPCQHSTLTGTWDYSSEERENSVLNNTVADDNGLGEHHHSMWCPSIGEIETAMLGPVESFNDVSMFGFNDIMESALLSDAANGFVDSSHVQEPRRQGQANGGESEGRENESGALMTVSSTVRSASDHPQHQRGDGSASDELFSSSSMASKRDDSVNWDWDDVVQGHDDGGRMVEDKQNSDQTMLTWLWESDSGEWENQSQLGEVDHEKQNAILAWLLS